MTLKEEIELSDIGHDVMYASSIPKDSINRVLDNPKAIAIINKYTILRGSDRRISDLFLDFLKSYGSTSINKNFYAYGIFITYAVILYKVSRHAAYGILENVEDSTIQSQLLEIYQTLNTH